MKMRLGDTVIELGNITYAEKRSDWLVYIYFIGTSEQESKPKSKPLKVYCGEEQTGRVVYPGSADELLTKIATLGSTVEELEHIAAMILNPNT